jgi:cytoskeletal protein CcmA (bactofilin family)
MTAMIGRSIHIKGDVTAREPLTIAGRVDGKVEADGHAVTIDVGGQIQADITAETIVVGGQVNGRLTAGARIVVRETASVEGDVSAPVVSLADGATVQGKIQTAPRDAASLRVA